MYYQVSTLYVLKTFTNALNFFGFIFDAYFVNHDEASPGQVLMSEPRAW
jgi:hypothetical protein